MRFDWPAPARLIVPIALGLANLAPLAAVIWLGWSAGELLALFWLETVVIAALAAASLWTFCLGDQGYSVRASSLMSLGFVAHCGLFVAGQGAFIGMIARFDLNGPAWAGLLDGLPLIASRLSQPDMRLTLAVLAAGHLIHFLRTWVMARGWNHARPGQVVTSVYARVLILHLAVVFGMQATLFEGGAVWPLAILCVVKAGAEITAAIDAEADRRLARQNAAG